MAGSQASQFVEIVAASMRPGSARLVADGDFASLLFPLAVRAAGDLTLRSVPLPDLLGAIDRGVDLVAVSLVQSADGSVTPLDELDDAARASGSSP